MERGARLRFRTQEFDRYFPEECDVYYILKYLALVQPSGRKPHPPDDENSCQIVFTADAKRMRDAGWARARYYQAEGATVASETASTRRS